MLRRFGLCALALGLLFSGPPSARPEEAKLIHLRNQVIATPSAPQSSKALQAQAADTAASGLFLIQFNDRFQPEWRDQLQAMGVTLLRYVPDDAFVARLRNVAQ